MNVQRGHDDGGRTGLRCATCHRETNNAASGVPGAPPLAACSLIHGLAGAINGRALPRTKDTTKERKSLATSPNRGTLGRITWSDGGGSPVRTAHRSQSRARLRQAGGALGADRRRMPTILSWSLRSCFLRWSAKVRSLQGDFFDRKCPCRSDIRKRNPSQLRKTQ